MRGKEDTETKTESRMQYKDNFIWDNAYLYYSYYSPSSPTIPLPAVALFVVPAPLPRPFGIREWRILLMIMMMY